MPLPLLSVVIPAYNVAPFIAAAVGSVLRQTMDDLEVIVVDDGSTDDTAALVGAFQDARLRLMRQDNKGAAGARNTGIRAARGRYLGLLDGDDIWMVTKAERHIAMLDADPDIAVSFSHSAYLGPDGTATGACLIEHVHRPSLAQTIRRNRVGNCSTPIGRTEDFREAGLFDQRLRANLDDYEMWPRLMRRTGKAIVCLPQCLTGHRIHETSSDTGFDAFLTHGELCYRLMRAEMPDLPRHWLQEGLAGHYRIAARKAASMGRGKLAARYLARAALLAPWLPLSDPRFPATLAVAVGGPKVQNALYAGWARLNGGTAN